MVLALLGMEHGAGESYFPVVACTVLFYVFGLISLARMSLVACTVIVSSGSPTDPGPPRCVFL